MLCFNDGINSLFKLFFIDNTYECVRERYFRLKLKKNDRHVDPVGQKNRPKTDRPVSPPVWQTGKLTDRLANRKTDLKTNRPENPPTG